MSQKKERFLKERNHFPTFDFQGMCYSLTIPWKGRGDQRLGRCPDLETWQIEVIGGHIVAV